LSAVISNTSMETFRIRHDGEWVTISIQGGQEGVDDAGGNHDLLRVLGNRASEQP
jgi:hypothetical protein